MIHGGEELQRSRKIGNSNQGLAGRRKGLWTKSQPEAENEVLFYTRKRGGGDMKEINSEKSCEKQKKTIQPRR